ncbi:MAT1 factor, partial [Polyodon spathula]|nr:MAT1 factor [Polyodon spathula]
MDDQGCPRCKTTKYRNPSLKLMVNVCGHTLCESCVEMLFIRGSGNCQECDTPLRKNNFRVQLFKDPTVDKEVEIRKKVLKIYKNDCNFPGLREYNDYLELIEEIVYNLTHNMDLENTKQMMEQYQRENKEIIQKNKIKLTREQEELEELLAMERQEIEQRRLLQIKEEKRQVLAKKKNKQALLDELESSQLPATLLLAQHKDRSAQLEAELEKQRQIVKPTTFSTGIMMSSGSNPSYAAPDRDQALTGRGRGLVGCGVLGSLHTRDPCSWPGACRLACTQFRTAWSSDAGQKISLQPVPKIEEVLYLYKPIHVETYGPPLPDLENLGRFGYLNHVRAASPQDLAGGYTSNLACHRALQDAFSGLFLQSV